MFGGYGAGFFAMKGYLSDMWEWDVDTQQYLFHQYTRSTLLNRGSLYGDSGDYTQGSWPGGRAFGATWSKDDGSLWFFGGYGHASSASNGGLLADVFSWSENENGNEGAFAYESGPSYTFQTVNYTTNATYATPGGRSHMAYGSWANGGKGLIFGGYAFGNYSSMNDLWAYDYDARSWENLHPGCDTANVTWGEKGIESEENCPPKLVGASGYVLDDALFVFSGAYQNYTASAKQYYNAVWRYNLLTNAWTWIAGSNATNVAGYYNESPLAPRDIPQMTPVDTDDPEKKKREVEFELEIELDPVAPATPSAPVTAPVPEPSTTPAPVDAPANAPAPESAPAPVIEPQEAPQTAPSTAPQTTPTTTPTAAPVDAPEPVPQASPVEAPTTAPTAAPEASTAPTSPTAAPEASTTPSSPESQFYPGARLGQSIQYYDGGFYVSSGVGYDAYGVFGNLDDLWFFDVDTANWTFIKGDLETDISNSYTSGTSESNSTNIVYQPNGRYYAHSWLDSYGNFWIGSGYWYLSSLEGFRNDLWAYSLEDVPSTPIEFSPVKPLPVNGSPASPSIPIEYVLDTYQYITNDNCGYYSPPSSDFVCVDYGHWAYPSSYTVNASETFTVSDNVQVDIYGDLTIASGGTLQMDVDCTISATGKANIYGKVALKMDLDTAQEIKDSDDIRDLRFLLVTHYEWGLMSKRNAEEQHGVVLSNHLDRKMSQTKRTPKLGSAVSGNVITSSGLEQVGMKGETYENARKRDVNNPIGTSGKGGIISSDCATFTYTLKDTLASSSQYQVWATVNKVNLSCRNSWWIALLIVLGVLLALIIIGAILIRFCRAKQPFHSMEGPNGVPVNPDDEELGGPYYIPPSAGVVPQPRINFNAIDESSNDINISDDAEEDSEEEESSGDMEESSEQEGSEEGSEEESEEEDDDEESSEY